MSQQYPERAGQQLTTASIYWAYTLPREGTAVLSPFGNAGASDDLMAWFVHEAQRTYPHLTGAIDGSSSGRAEVRRPLVAPARR